MVAGHHKTKLVLSFAILLLLIYSFVYDFPIHPTLSTTSTSPADSSNSTSSELIASLHPIDQLVRQAEVNFERLTSDQANGLNDAAAEYRRRRGRHPPPAFDEWYAFAQDKNATIIEEMFDQIYLDLEPFWGLEASWIQRQASKFPNYISIRDRHAQARYLDYAKSVWLRLWQEMLMKIEYLLPDVDMAFNSHDEPKLYVPWEEMNEYMAEANKTRRAPMPTHERPILNNFAQYEVLNADVPADYDDAIEFTNLWDVARRTCPPGSPGRDAALDSNYTTRPDFPPGGYVSNWTDAKSACANPNIRNIHGAIIAPRYKFAYSKIFPIFSGCKMQGINADILVPPAMYWNREELFSGSVENGLRHIGWEDKAAAVGWRGQASGGDSNSSNWRRMQRHRFVAMLNGTQVASAERIGTNATADNFPVPPTDRREDNPWPIAALETTPSTMSAWVKSLADVAFVHLMCDPWVLTQFTDGAHCDYLEPYYHTEPHMNMSEEYHYRYLPDIDGYSFSGRYRAFLRSYSLPIKATIFAEWHDTRLIPWKHFVPMHNSFSDLWGILDYFIGYDPDRLRLDHETIGDDADVDTIRGESRKAARSGHDEVAKRIAMDGSEWADQTLRREDMLIYMYRLILEYARICDERREYLGWTADLMGD